MSLRDKLQERHGYNLKCGNLVSKHGTYKFVLNDTLKEPIDKFIETIMLPSKFVNLESTLMIESECGMREYTIWSGKLPLSSIYLEQIEYLNKQLRKMLNKAIPASGLDIMYQRRDGKDVVVVTWYGKR